MDYPELATRYERLCIEHGEISELLKAAAANHSEDKQRRGQKEAGTSTKAKQ
jgi:hypothetical protein